MRSGNASDALANVGGLWQHKVEGISQPAPPRLRQYRQLPLEHSSFLPGCYRFNARLEQFGEELVRAFALIFKVSPMAARDRLHLDQFGLQALNFLLEGSGCLLTCRRLRPARDRRMIDFGEVDVHQGLAIV